MIGFSNYVFLIRYWFKREKKEFFDGYSIEELSLPNVLIFSKPFTYVIKINKS